MASPLRIFTDLSVSRPQGWDLTFLHALPYGSACAEVRSAARLSGSIGFIMWKSKPTS